ncbi:MAG: spore maturation protein [Bacilli bacterium]
MSVYIIPIVIIFIIGYGLIKKVNIYDVFLDGAKEGLITTFSITGAVLAMMFAIKIFLGSGFIYGILGFLDPFLKMINLPLDIVPMMLLRPISGTASLAIMNDIFYNFGPDSYLGRLASTIQGCTDTTIYVLALYFGSVRITKTRYALVCGLFADLVGIIAAIIIVKVMFGY